MIQQSPRVIALELTVLVIGGLTLWKTILDRWKEPMPPGLVESGKKTMLDPQFRTKMERSLGGRIRRVMYAIEVGAKRLAAKW